MDLGNTIDLLTSDHGGVAQKRRALITLLMDPAAIQEAINTLMPWPGTPEARLLGCRCPVLDNQELQGTGRRIVLSSCQLHWPKERR